MIGFLSPQVWYFRSLGEMRRDALFEGTFWVLESVKPLVLKRLGRVFEQNECFEKRQKDIQVQWSVDKSSVFPMKTQLPPNVCYVDEGNDRLLLPFFFLPLLVV